MTENSVFIHSTERLGSLLSDLNMNEQDYAYNSGARPDDSLEVEKHDHQDGDDANMGPHFDILTVDRHDDEENDSTGSNNTQEGEMQNDLVGTAGGYFSGNIDRTLQDPHKSSVHNDNSLKYNELENDYEYYKNMILNDSLEESQIEQGEIHDKLSSIPKDNDFEPIDPNYEGEFPKRRESQLVPKFKYKDPNPRFLEKNKLDISKVKKTSYRQKYLDDRNGSKKKTKNGDSNRSKDMTSKVKDDMNFGFETQSDRNQIPLGGTSMGTHLDGSGGKDQMRHLRENIEISRLDDMIREEENNLKNDVLNLPLSQPYAQLNYPEVTDFGYNHNDNYNYTQQDDTFDTNKAFQNVPEYPLSSISKAPEHNKRASYAEIHSVLQDRNPVEGDEISSYAAQHLEKKLPHNYKTYSLKEYRVINKDIKLQKSLGPDLGSVDYLAKKARAEKKKDYASAVAAHNQQHVKMKKVRSAPPPSTKERAKESRRIAALEYARNIKNFAKKSPKPPVRTRPATDDRKELSALEIMKQRHEAEKIAIDKMRKNLAGIIKEVKS